MAVKFLYRTARVIPAWQVNCSETVVQIIQVPDQKNPGSCIRQLIRCDISAIFLKQQINFVF